MLRRGASLSVSVLALVIATAGCKGGSPQDPSTAKSGPKGTSCASIAADLISFGEVLESSSADAKTRIVTYAGLLELLLSFEGAAVELDQQLAGMKLSGTLESKVKNAHVALEKSAQFARGEREGVEKHAHDIAPLAKETQEAWSQLRGLCGVAADAASAKKAKGPPDCGAVREAVLRFDAAETTAEHDKAVADLTALRLATPAIAKSRDRAVAASKAVQAAIKTRAEAAAPMPRRWAAVQKDLAVAMDGLVQECKHETPFTEQLIAAEHPDPRKLTVLVHVKPPAGVERSLLSLAASTKDEDEKAFYQARAEGAFGSGFFLVKKTEKGNEVLVVTNRHVVELGDRALLELADGTPLGVADVVYSNPAHDLAVLRPTGKLAVTEGFSFSRAPAKDQQTVIATGFPGMVGRPSYQTTKGYVSNESFRLDDGTRPLTYVQHTAPIDPGSSGGPLTDESGRVLGVNTMKVTGREAVGLAVPSRYVLDTLRTAGLIETRHASPPNRQKDSRLACLAFLGELGSAEPRMLVLEQMISNHLIGVEGLEDAASLGGEEGFEHLWNVDSVRAMRIATLVRLRTSFLAGGGPSILETCDDIDTPSIKADQVKYRVRLANFETREMALRWEHGRWKVDGFDAKLAGGPKPSPKKGLPPPGPPSAPPSGKKVLPPRGK